MKRKIYAGLLLASLITVNVSAKPFSSISPETTQVFSYKTCYETKTEGKCKVTYKITTKYFLCCVVSVSKCVIIRECSGTPDGQNP